MIINSYHGQLSSFWHIVRVKVLHCTGKTALQDLVVHLDPDFAKHKAGREVMQKLEDTFGEEGPGLEVGQRLPLWPLKCAAWSRTVHKAGGDGQASSPATPQLQSVDYMLVYFTVSLH